MKMMMSIAVLATCCSTGIAHASSRQATYPDTCQTHGSTQSGRKALIMANTEYPDALLNNPKNDADLIREQLVPLDFLVVVCKDLAVSGMEASVDTFIDSLSESDLALFYYAGHGNESDAVNYMIGVDSTPRRPRRMPLQRVLQQLGERSNSGISIAIFDACRTDPTRRADEPVGFSGESPMAGTYVAFSTAVGKTAADGAPGTHSPFARALADSLAQNSESDIDLLFRAVIRDTAAATPKEQRPWVVSSLPRMVVLKPASAAMAAATPAALSEALWGNLGGHH